MRLRKAAESYSGLAIAAAPGTHLATLQALERYVPKSAKVLDFGCYEGAMLARLRKAGYLDVEGTDLQFRLADDNITFTEADFNEDFAAQFGANSYDALVVSEVIEHLDDPRAFLKNARFLLKDGGILIASTPNIAFFEGRLKFLLTGELWGFGANNYRGQRHITAISRGQVPLLFAECGYSVAEVSTAASYATLFRKVLTSPIWIPMRLLMGPSVLGESLIVVAAKIPHCDESYSSGALWSDKHKSH
jgi:SAM-dependent methyltransferase